MDPTKLTSTDNNAASASSASDAPVLDMSAIDFAVAATEGQGNNIQQTFDVDSISLDNTPTSDADLQRQLSQDPEMSLAGADAPELGGKSVEFADAEDVSQESLDPVKQDVDIYVDPLNGPVQPPAPKKTEENAEQAGFLAGDLKNPDEEKAEEQPAPAVAENVMTAPAGKKSKKGIFIIIGCLILVAGVVAAIVFLTSGQGK